MSITVHSVTHSLQKISVTKLYGMKIKQRPHNEPEYDVVVLFKFQIILSRGTTSQIF